MTTAIASLSNPVPLRQDASVIGLVGLAHASSHFSHLLLPLLFPVFMHEFGLDFTQLGFLMTVFFAVSGLGQAGAGFLVDHIGARPMMIVALDLFVLACLLASQAGGYGGLMWVAAPVFFAGMGAAVGWRNAYVAAAVMYLVILAVLLVYRDQLRTQVAPPVVHAHGIQAEHSLALMKLPVVWWCFGFLFLSTMTLAVVQSFSVTILKAMHGIGFEAATLTLTAYMFCGALGVLVGGFIAARTVSSDRVVAWAMAVGAALALLLSVFAALGVGQRTPAR